MSTPLASVITIGDELLIGQTIDTNSAWIGQQLNKIGIDLRRRVAVGDDAPEIIHALDEEIKASDIIILTGGLGPTADDITKPLLARYFGSGMRTDERVLQHVKDIFSRLNRPMLERNMLQANVPEACTVLFNSRGTAPGMWFERDGRVIVSLPGVPHEMAGLMEDEVLPRLAKMGEGHTIRHYSIITAGEGESFLAEKIKDLEESLPPHIKLAYLPGARMVKLRLTGRAADAATLDKELTHHRDLLMARLADYVIAEEDMPLEVIVMNRLKALKKTLALAESCTGGSMAGMLTNMPGASACVRGGVVCYHRDVKEQTLGVKKETIDQHGIVSEATAAEMAAGARSALGANIGVGITGFLGPTADGTAPVGTICIGVADSTRTTTTTLHLRYERSRNKEVAISAALQHLLQFLAGK